MCTLSCALSLYCTLERTILLFIHQILTVLTISFLFNYLLILFFFSFSHGTAPDPDTPHLHLLTPLPSPLCSTLSLPLFMVTLFFHLTCSSFPSPPPPPLLHLSPPFCFSCNRLPVSSSLQRGKAASPSRLQWPIESCWAPISLLIGWEGLSRYWEDGLALLASCLSAYLYICLPAWPYLSLQQGWPQ